MQQHLISLMRLGSKYYWNAILSFHAAVLDPDKASLATWGGDFSETGPLISPSQTVFPRNCLLQAKTTPTSPQPVATSSAIIVASGTVLAPAVTRHINREWNTFVHIPNFRITHCFVPDPTKTSLVRLTSPLTSTSTRL